MPPAPCDDLLNRMAGQFGERFSVVDVDPGIGLAGGKIELPQVDGDVQLVVVKAEIAVMRGDVDLLLHAAVGVGLHEFRGERPVEGVAVVGADALQMAGIGSFAVDRVEEIAGAMAPVLVSRFLALRPCPLPALPAFGAFGDFCTVGSLSRSA